MSAPTQVRSLDRLPKTGSLIIPGRLDSRLAADLVSALKGRTITWLAEESTALSQDLQNYLQTSGLDGASFSKIDPIKIFLQ